MTGLAKIIIFLLGLSISLQVIAALYGFIDRWYIFRTAYIKVFQRIVVWSLAATAVYWLLSGSLRPAFLWGMIGYVFLYVVIFCFYHILFSRNTKFVKTK
jgi:hypothetical protein